MTIKAYTRRIGVRIRQRETNLRVIKSRWLPRDRRMARLASLREPAGHVIRIRCSLEILQMARNAGARR